MWNLHTLLSRISMPFLLEKVYNFVVSLNYNFFFLGHGESILKVCLAHSIVKLIEDGYSAQDATEKALDSMTSRLDQTAGAITLSNKGDVGIYFTTERMAWSYVQGNQIHYGIDKNQHDQEGFNVNQLILWKDTVCFSSSSSWSLAIIRILLTQQFAG